MSPLTTIYIVEYQFKSGRRRKGWAAVAAGGQIAPNGFHTSYSTAKGRVDLYGAHDNCEYRIVPYNRGTL